MTLRPRVGRQSFAAGRRAVPEYRAKRQQDEPTMSLKAALIAAAMAVAAPAALAHDYKAGAIEIGHPWARATPRGASVAAGYIKLTNTGSTPDRLVGGTPGGGGGAEILP